MHFTTIWNEFNSSKRLKELLPNNMTPKIEFPLHCMKIVFVHLCNCHHTLQSLLILTHDLNNKSICLYWRFWARLIIIYDCRGSSLLKWWEFGCLRLIGGLAINLNTLDDRAQKGSYNKQKNTQKVTRKQEALAGVYHDI